MLVPINGAVSFAIRDLPGVAGVAEPPGAPGFWIGSIRCRPLLLCRAAWGVFPLPIGCCTQPLDRAAWAAAVGGAPWSTPCSRWRVGGRRDRAVGFRETVV